MRTTHVLLLLCALVAVCAEEAELLRHRHRHKRDDGYDHHDDRREHEHPSSYDREEYYDHGYDRYADHEPSDEPYGPPRGGHYPIDPKSLTIANLVYHGLDKLEPNIDATTMDKHYNKHYKAYVDNLNAATTAATGGTGASGMDLTELIKLVRKLDGDLFTAVRNQGGGAWNHALYFKHLAPNTSANTNPSTSISPALLQAIQASFGSVTAMQDAVRAAALKVFGSGWAWVCYTGKGDELVVTTTPNQDNPLMGNLPSTPEVKSAGCTPILGLDIWEHAYYLKHQNVRANYITEFWKVVDWTVVSKNFAAAQAGNVQSMVE